MELSSASASSSSSSDAPFVDWFMKQRGNEAYVRVEDEYLQDDFNLTGLSDLVPVYDSALNMILDCEDSESESSLVEESAQELYGLAHARFLMSTKGQVALGKKFESGVYGTCPNSLCGDQKVLPVGSDIPKQTKARVYCPVCCEIYIPRKARLDKIDGAHFGSSAALVWFMNNAQSINRLDEDGEYTPAIFGFKQHVNKDARETIRKLLEGKQLEERLGQPVVRMEEDDNESD